MNAQQLASARDSTADARTGNEIALINDALKRLTAGQATRNKTLGELPASTAPTAPPLAIVQGAARGLLQR